MSSRGWLARAAGSGALVVLLSGLSLPPLASAGPVPKAFAPGCWKGKGQGTIIGLRSPAPGITINIDRSAFAFTLRATKKKVTGTLDVDGHGTGESTAGGVTATVELTLSGKPSLSGKPAAVVVNGDMKLVGTAQVAGTSAPLDLSGPIANVPLVIKKATLTKVSGTVGPNGVWAAVRKGSTC